jgi:inorganic pyrophosphatase|tara:strand:+ start:229 stop:546 length:318 start_codon:yes stop_codon:yes gene_type:complete
MSVFFIESQSTNLVRYQVSFNINDFKNEHVVFSGALGKHPFDSNKIVLISDPHINNTSYYEFTSADIGLIQKLPNIINSDGDDAAMALLWIKKGSIATKSSIFIV